MEEDFTQIQHFGISDYTANLNDDYTMALISKKFQKKERVVENEGIETYKEIKLKNLLATPSHLCHRTGFVDSPLPPVFCTPGLKVLKREIPSLPVETMKTAQEHSDIHSGKELKGISATPAFLSLGSDVDSVYSPRPPVFCTPGLKVHKNDIGLSQAWEHKQPIEAVHPQKQTLPALHRKGLDIAEPLPRPELSYGEYLEEPASLVLNSDHYADPAVRDYCVGTPPRPEMTMNITEDIFKYSVKPSSPPKVSKYEKLLWTPERPEMTSCITEDITQILAKYNKAKATDMAWDNQSGTSSAYDKRTPESEDKENRMY
ncbi:hypothetical protein GDO86_012948 [Hymenochirus boettgeri]|uniref:Uncharacterized protein n=1 Tax=Hymenochirus boettgeri TaxID=247094 RepID=A0A8T2IWK6_9PIPI|nr:hypothetical protein GDO86_012948 [Hymenochirus boettgeri]